MGLCYFLFHSWPAEAMGQTANSPANLIWKHFTLHCVCITLSAVSWKEFSALLVIWDSSVTFYHHFLSAALWSFGIQDNLSDAGVSTLPFLHVNDIWQCWFPLNSSIQAPGAFPPVSSAANPSQTFRWCCCRKHACHFTFYQILLTQHNEIEALKAATTMRLVSVPKMPLN